ncbi:MAG: hypothetical protein KGJ32_09295 [Xanthomonadaceae bacterium]|nr:hypothetical protein [Xanthomonadaceae bacterium]
MNIKKRNFIRYSIPFSVVAFFVWLHQIYVTRVHPDAVFMDSLRLVYQLEQWRHGQLSFLKLWGLGAEHQGFINQFMMLLNIKYFSYDVLLANRLTGIVVALIAIIILLNLNSRIRKYDKDFPATLLAVRTGVSALIVLICFSWANFELFTLDLGLSLWIKNLSFVAYFSVHAYYLTMPTKAGRAWIVGLGLALVGPVIVLMLGMGWSYSFVAAVLVVGLIAAVDPVKNHDVRTPLLKSVPTIALLLAQMVYLMASVGTGGATAAHQKFSTLPHVPGLLLYALGSGLIGVETIGRYPALLHALPYVSGGALAAAAVLLFVRIRHELYSGSLLPIYLLAYGFFTALSVSVARGGGGAAEVMASRYYMDIMFFYVGLVWLWYDSLERSPTGQPHVSMALFFALCMVVIVGQGLTYRREWLAAPYRASAFKSMNQALLQGVPNQQAASLLQSPLENARKGDGMLLEHHLALYSNHPVDECELADVHYLGGWYARESQGVWMGRRAVMQIPACRCDFVATVYLPPGFSERTLEISGTEFIKSINLLPGKVGKLRIPPSDSQRKMDISVSRTTVPSSVSGGVRDGRELGVLWTSKTFVCGRGGLN